MNWRVCSSTISRFDHQVHMDGPCRQLGDPRHQVRKEQEAGGETGVRDVDVMEVDVGLDALQVALQIGEIGRPQRELAEQPVARQGGDGGTAGEGFAGHDATRLRMFE